MANLSSSDWQRLNEAQAALYPLTDVFEDSSLRVLLDIGDLRASLIRVRALINEVMDANGY